MSVDVQEIVSLGESGGAGQLIIAKVVQIHIDKKFLDKNGDIDSEKLDLVARMGGDWYTRSTKESMFKIPKALKLEEKIRLIWDFRGPDCEKIAKHYKIHLSDFLNTNNSVYFDFNDRKITALHHMVYLIVL